VAPATFPDVDEQLRIIRRGTAGIVVESEFRTKLERSRGSGRPLLVKLGLDPTAPDLHLGHTVVLRKLRDFQELGHQIVVIIGDFTGLIGDPTGRTETRKPLTRDDILANAETYRGQLGKVVDMDRARVEFNSTWLARLTLEDVIRLTAQVTVAQMLQREDFAARYGSGRPIGVHELLYPIAQAYDSVALGADVELGGTDQTFNLLVGRDLQRGAGQEPQIALTVPILEGLDGTAKMSKSLGNYVGINEPPDEIFGKLMSLSDALMWRYFELLTRLGDDEVSALRAAHPMEAKKRLAWTITAQYHGAEAADRAAARFARVHQERDVPADVETVPLPRAGGAVPGQVRESEGLRWPVWLVLREAGLVESNSDARRMIQQGAVEVDGRRISDLDEALESGRGYLIQVGKRRFKRVILERPSLRA
jgi:tyrosyl-tRNA synthetase